ncbi:MAG: hypothetical protein JNM33_07655 [Rubrivivax sp.]|nr:hypothetical protein [Rubrivivax sp.]
MTHRPLLVAALLGTLVTAALAQAPAAPAMPPLHVQRVEFIDRQGFEKPMVAATMMVPAGWRTQSAVQWQIGSQCAQGQHLRLQATAPDGASMLELLPGEAWGRSNFGPVSDCPQAGWADVRAYLEAWVQRHRPGARWLDFRARPDRSQPEFRSTMPGNEMRMSFEAGQALIGYSAGGRELRETLATVVVVTHQSLAGLQPGTSLQSITGRSLGVLALRVPDGQLDFRRFDALWSTLRSDPAWSERIRRGNAQMAAENQATQAAIGQIQAQTSRETLAAMARRGEMAAQTRAEIAAINNGTWQAGQASQDRRHTEAVRTVREVEAWRDPRGGNAVLELPGHYRHAWQLRDGSYVLTDDAQFDPARTLGQPGVALSRAERGR